MKKLFIVFLVCLVSLSMQAQNKMSDSKMASHKMGTKNKDCVMMDNGKMTIMKNGKMMDMNEDMTLRNGTVVMKDGSVKMKNGKSMTLKDGDCVWMNGMVTHKKAGANKNKM